MPTNVKQTVTALETALIELTERAQRQADVIERVTQRAEQLEKRLARGTLDGEAITPAPKTKPAAVVVPDGDLSATLERILRAQPVSTADAATLLDVPVSHAAHAIRALRKAHKIANAGTHDEPRWVWILGDDCPTPALVAMVEQLLRNRPMTLQELVDVTGARRNRLSGALVLLRRHGVQIDNTGNGWRAVWSIAAPKPRARRQSLSR